MNMRVSRRTFIRVVGGACLTSIACASAEAENREGKKPLNIVWIMADDMGYGDLGCYVPHYAEQEQRQTLADTPNLDALARKSMLFTQVYAGQSMCAPSRATLLTGRHSGHNNCREIWDRKGGRIGLKPGTPTFATVLKKAGYRTGNYGKWHALHQTRGPMKSDDTKLMPHFGWDDWMVRHWWGNDRDRGTNYWPSNVSYNGKQILVQGKQFFGDMVADYACNFMKGRHNKPFVAYVNFTVPHTKFEAPNRKELAEKHGWDEETAGYVWLLERLDKNVGTILDCLREQGLARNTVVFFTSDNGGINWGNLGSVDYRDLCEEQPINGGLRRGKSALYEGGIRVPMIVSCPGTIPQGVVSDQPWYFPDAMATFADIAGAEQFLPKQHDGRSVWPVLQGNRERLDPRPLYWNGYLFEPGFRQVVRLGCWKLMRFSALERSYGLATAKQPKSPPPAHLELYNLDKDPGERNNVAKIHPEICRKLTGIMKDEYTPHPEYPLSENENKVFKIQTWDDIAEVYPH